jgi:tetratricopeptide (TPR) repeat protein
MDIDDSADYLRFLEDSFLFAEKNRNQEHMGKIVDALGSYLRNSPETSARDVSLYWTYKSRNEDDSEEALQDLIRAVQCLPEITPETAELAANAYNNLGMYYSQCDQRELALENMAHCVKITKQFSLNQNDENNLNRCMNLAVLKAECGEIVQAMDLLQELARRAQDGGVDQLTLANLDMAMGTVSLYGTQTDEAQRHYSDAISRYEVVFGEQSPEVIALRQQLSTAIEAGNVSAAAIPEMTRE